MTVNVIKAAALVVALVCVTVLTATGSIDDTAGVGLIAWVVGYLTGNGVSMLRNIPSTPVYWRREKEQENA